MEKHELENLKNKMEDEKEYLEGEIKKLAITPDMGDDVDSGEEEADESAALEDNLALMENYKLRVADIEEALRKIEKGEYGVCGNCSEKISVKVLEASPESKLCQACKQNENQ